MILQSAIDDFLAEQQFRGNTPKTVEYYRESLKRFSEFAGVDSDIESVTIPILRQYHSSLKSRGLSSNTIQTYIRALRTFLRYCYSQEYLPADITLKFKLPRAQKKEIDVLSDEEIATLFSCFNPRYYLQLRNACMCALMLDSGLRMNEVVTLEMDKLKLTEGYAIVSGKGQKERAVPIGLNTRRMLNKYIRRRPITARTGRVFVMANGMPVELSTMKELFRKLKKRTNIPRLRAHLLRHTFATRYLENGGNIYDLQQILGHTSLEMVRRYVHTTQRKFVPKFPEYSPIDRLLGKR